MRRAARPAQAKARKRKTGTLRYPLTQLELFFGQIAIEKLPSDIRYGLVLLKGDLLQSLAVALGNVDRQLYKPLRCPFKALFGAPGFPYLRSRFLWLGCALNDFLLPLFGLLRCDVEV